MLSNWQEWLKIIKLSLFNQQALPKGASSEGLPWFQSWEGSQWAQIFLKLLSVSWAIPSCHSSQRCWKLFPALLAGDWVAMIYFCGIIGEKTHGKCEDCRHVPWKKHLWSQEAILTYECLTKSSSHSLFQFMLIWRLIQKKRKGGRGETK